MGYGYYHLNIFTVKGPILESKFHVFWASDINEIINSLFRETFCIKRKYAVRHKNKMIDMVVIEEYEVIPIHGPKKVPYQLFYTFIFEFTNSG